MDAQIYASTSPRRPTLRAVFDKGKGWGADRGGHLQQNWRLESEVNLARPNRALPFKADEALDSIQAHGIFQYVIPGSFLVQQQHILLNNYRLGFTLPLFSDVPDLALLGTGTLFEHEDRQFLITADHVFREDENDPNSRLIDMSAIAAPSDPRPAGRGSADIVTLGDHVIHRLPPPVLIDVIVLELKSEETIKRLKTGWSFLSFDEAEPLRPDDDRFVITGYLREGLKWDGRVVSQAMLNLETDFYWDDPAVKEPTDFDHFFYLQQEMATVDGKQRRVDSIKGLSGGPIWAVRDVAKTALWHPAKAMKIIAVQSSEFQGKEKWARGVDWRAVLAILRGPSVGFLSPP